jgi:uroporphyrinogen decarboxylase
MTPRDVILEQIQHHETVPVPYTVSFEEGVAERIDAHYGNSEWREQLVPYITMALVVDTTREEEIDEVYRRDAFGGLWRYDRRPFHQEEPAMKEPSFDDYAFPSPDVFVDAPTVDAARALLEQHPDSFRVAYIGWGLFEQSWRIRGFENALTDAVAEPDFFAELIRRLRDLYLAFVEQCAGLPADAVMFGDDWGDQRGVILGPDRWRRFIQPAWAEIYDAVHAQGKLVISHCCGSIADIMPDIVEMGLDMLESVQPEAAGMVPYELKRQWGDDIAFWGGLGSQSTIPFGSPDEIRAEVRRLCAEMGKGGGYILSPAKSLQPETPTENLVAVVESFTRQS